MRTGYSPHTEEYETYLRSKWWGLLRYLTKKRDGFRCRCGSTENLAVHHETYKRLGNERLEDLITLCETCHEAEHIEKNETALWSARLYGWATKKYGEDWEWREDIYQVQAEFEDWLDKNEAWE